LRVREQDRTGSGAHPFDQYMQVNDGIAHSLHVVSVG
jgi:hypothetical protein